MNNFDETKTNFENVNDHSLRLTRDFDLKNVPAEYFLMAAGGVFGLSVLLAATRRKKSWANFVSGLIPSILLLGVYNKINHANKGPSIHPRLSTETQADLHENMSHIH